MRIGVLGINHKSADLSCREFFAKACYKRLNTECEDAEKLHCVLLLTCHRSEVYFSAEDLASAHSSLLQILRVEIDGAFEHKLYAYFGSDCFAHLAKVAAGLDSLVIAETEIQRQVKQAYEQTCLHYRLPSDMHFLFQKSLQLGKYVRSHFPLSHGQITIPKMMYEITSHLFSELKESRILFIGNSEINRKVLSYFKQRGMDKLSLCTRSLLSAKELERKHRMALLDWSQLSQWRTYDIVIAGTNASSFLIHSDESVVKTRLIFDLGVPRNVNPRLSWHPSVVLLNIDELGKMLEMRQIKNKKALKDLEMIVEKKVKYHVASYTDKRLALCL